MHRRSLAWAAVACLGALCALASPAAAGTPAHFRVGAAVRSLAPTVPVYSGGFSLSPPIMKMRDPLEVRAFYVSNGRRAVAFAVVDSQAYFSAYQEGSDYGITSVRADAAREISAAGGPKLGQGDIVVQGTHSHAAPTLEGIWGPVPPVYLKEVHDRTVDALRAAAAAARPARLKFATIADPNIAGVNINQDSYEGWANDPQISVLRAVDPRDGATIATFDSIPTHGAHICGQCDAILSADYFGAVRARLDRALGGISVVGPATLGREESPVETTGAANMEWISGVITNDVIEALGHARWITSSTIGSTESFISIPATNAALLALNDMWSLPDAQKQQEASASGVYPIDRDNKPPYRSGTILGTYLTALRIADVAFLSMPGEPFPEVRFSIANATPHARAVIALSKGQDDFGYFYPSFITPFPEVYNSDHAVFNVAPQAGDQIIQAQVSNLAALGFAPNPAQERPGNNNYGQKLKPGLQALASPPTGDADRHGRFSAVMQAIYMPASVVDAPLAGRPHWSFGDGTSATTGYLSVGQDFGQTGQGPHGTPRFRHAFPVGLHRVQVNARDTDGNAVAWTLTVRVYPHLVARAACTLHGGRARFAGAVKGGEGTVLAWRWRFRGGARVSGRRVTRDRARSGTLTVVDAAGGVAHTTAHCAPTAGAPGPGHMMRRSNRRQLAPGFVG